MLVLYTLEPGHVTKPVLLARLGRIIRTDELHSLIKNKGRQVHIIHETNRVGRLLTKVDHFDRYKPVCTGCLQDA